MVMCSLIIEPRNIESQIADSDPVYKPLIIKTSPHSLRLIIYGESCGMTVCLILNCRFSYETGSTALQNFCYKTKLQLACS